MPVTVAAAMIVGSVISGVASMFSSRSSNRASNRAVSAQSAANDRAMAIEQESERRRREEFDRVERQNQARWELEQRREQSRYETSLRDQRRLEAVEQARYARDEARKAPYRAIGASAVAELSRLAGVPMRPGAPPPSMPSGWSEQAMSPPTGGSGFNPAAEAETLVSLARRGGY
jgi:membrane protein involved in colicin uptake